MTPTQYQSDVQRTLSNKFHQELVPCGDLLLALRGAIRSLEYLDVIKKSLFYGKPNSLPVSWDNQSVKKPTYGQLIPKIHDEKGEIILHAIIGIATEAGELLEALVNCIDTETGMDRVNLKEEAGDGLWYFSVLLTALGFSFEETMDVNIDKLKLRFPEKFSEELAINRDVGAERKVLEFVRTE